MNFRNLSARAAASWVAVLGLGRVLVLVAVLAMGEGFSATLIMSVRTMWLLGARRFQR